MKQVIVSFHIIYLLMVFIFLALPHGRLLDLFQWHIHPNKQASKNHIIFISILLYLLLELLAYVLLVKTASCQTKESLGFHKKIFSEIASGACHEKVLSGISTLWVHHSSEITNFAYLLPEVRSLCITTINSGPGDLKQSASLWAWNRLEYRKQTGNPPSLITHW